MASLDMDGPFLLDKDLILDTIAASPGNFALGRLTPNKRFAVAYVGRSDSNLQDALLTAIQRGLGQPGLLARLFGRQKKLNAFKFSYAADQEAAFTKECRNFHNFGGADKLANKAHPKPPNGSNAACPYCRDARGVPL